MSLKDQNINFISPEIKTIMATIPRYSYNKFRSYIKGRGYSSINISVLWMAYKDNKITNKDLDDVRVLKAYLESKEPKLRSKVSPEIKASRKESLLILKNILPYFGTKYAPKEILWNMMVFLDPVDILSLCRTNKYFASTVCGDKFWKHYAKTNYGIAILGSHNSWRDWIINSSRRYDGVISIRNIQVGDRFGKVVEPLVSDYAGNFKKMISDNIGSIYYYIDDNLKVYYIDTSPRTYPVISVPVLADKRIIDAHTYTNPNRDFYLVFMVETDGTIYYTLNKERKPIHKNRFKILPGIKADKIYDNYIIQPNRSIIHYKVVTTEDDLRLVFSTIETPTPFTFISEYQKNIRVGGVFEKRTWTIALDDTGQVWAKGYNLDHQLGLGSKRSFANFNQVKLTKSQEAPFFGTSIKKAVSNLSRTALLATDSSVWIMGNLYGEVIPRPRKIELVYKRTLKGVVKSQVLHIIDIAISWYRIYFIDDKNTIYAMEKTNKIIKVSVNIPASYKKYQISFIGPVKKEYDVKWFYIKKKIEKRKNI